MMLHAVAAENLGRAVVTMDGQRDGQRALGIFQAGTFIIGYLEAVGDGIELPARHLENGMVVNLHDGRIAGRREDVQSARGQEAASKLSTTERGASR
jgi:hypothetical protein